MKISDEKLLALCDRFGKRALVWRRKFTGLLPEVNRRRLYERRGCQSIYEFAQKFAGLSKDQVQNVLRLRERFEDKPVLKTLLEEGNVSVNKLARIVSIATPENEEELAEKVKLLPRQALETLVRDERKMKNGLLEPLFEEKSLHVQTFKLSPEVVEKLNRFQEQGQDVNGILLELLEQREEKIEREKERLANKPTRSRTIPTKVRKILQEEHGRKCSIPTCSKPAAEIHHTQRFALSHSHDPHYLAPLCKQHHQIAHTIDQKVMVHRQVMRS